MTINRFLSMAAFSVFGGIFYAIFTSLVDNDGSIPSGDAAVDWFMGASAAFIIQHIFVSGKS